MDERCTVEALTTIDTKHKKADTAAGENTDRAIGEAAVGWAVHHHIIDDGRGGLGEDDGIIGVNQLTATVVFAHHHVVGAARQAAKSGSILVGGPAVDTVFEVAIIIAG